MAFEVRSYRPSDFHNLNDLLWRSFPQHFKNDPPDYFRDYIEADPFHRDCDLKVICDNSGKVLSTAKVFRRWVWYKGKQRLMGGIGNVATTETHRGKGLSQAILGSCCKAMSDAGCAFAALYAGPIPLYEKFGFKKTPLASWKFSEFMPISDKGTSSIQRVVWKEDLLTLMQLHSETIARTDFGVERNPLYWEKYILAFKGKNTTTWKYLEEGTTRAYLSLSFDSKEDYCEIKDFCLPNPDVARKILSHAISESKTGSVRLPVSGESSVAVRALKEISGKVDQTSYEGFMVKEMDSELLSGTVPDYRNVMLARVDGF